MVGEADAMKLGKCLKKDNLRVSEILPAFEKAELAKAPAAGSGSTP